MDKEMGLHKGQTTLTSWKPGQSGNIHGRPKGAKNKYTKEMRLHIQKVTGKHIKNIEADLETMTPSERWKVLCALMKYTMSTKKEVSGKVQGNVQINVNYIKKEIEGENETGEIMNG